MKNNNINKMAYDTTSLVMISGVFAILFGIVALVWPGITLVSLAIITAIWLFVSGIVSGLTSIFMRDKYEHWVLNLLLSVLKFAVGAYLVQRPEITVATFVFIIAIALIVEGIVDVIFGLTDDSDDTGIKVLSAILGFLTLGAGIIIWRYPVEGSLAFVWVLGLIALIRGTFSLWFAIDARHKLKNADK